MMDENKYTESDADVCCLMLSLRQDYARYGHDD